MRDVFVENEWDVLCKRLRASAEHIGSQTPNRAESIQKQADEFCQQSAPERYPDLLDRVRAATELAKQWQDQRDAA